MNYQKTYFVLSLSSVCCTIVFLILINFPNGLRKCSYLLLVDKENKLSETRQYENVYRSLPSFPVAYWQKNRKKNLELNQTCAKFPSLFDVQFQNLYWQNLRSSYGHYQFFGAYLDNRAANLLGPTVRILAMVDQVDPITSMYCQIWFVDRRQPVIIRASTYDLAWNRTNLNYKTGIYQPYLIPCHIPSEYHHLTVAAVSLVEKECDTSSNALTVFYNKPVGKKHDFAICVKGLNFLLEDISSVLIEWIEMMTLLGAHKIFIYNLHVHPNISKVLKYYEALGRVEVVPLTLAAGQPNTPYWQHIYLKNRHRCKLQGEIIPYNDCLYKHMYEYKYVVLVDVDEVIVPLNGTTWKDLFDRFDQQLDKKYDSYITRNLHFTTDLFFTHQRFDDIPEYMNILNHVNHAPTMRPGSPKSFYNTETVLSVNNHFPIACLLGSCKNFPVDPKDALMHHYKRKPTKVYQKFRNTSIQDTIIWKYKKPLIERVTKVLKELGFLVPKK